MPVSNIRPELVKTKSLTLVQQTREQVRMQIEQMSPYEKAQLSAAWLARLSDSAEANPWVHGFLMVQSSSGNTVGHCGFKGPPGADGVVEIAYGVQPEYEGMGFATEAAEALTRFAFNNPQVRKVIAHTLPQVNASARILTKCGFTKIGEVIDPEDGLVWRWEKQQG
jgi:ribosomal-protein-alanine N-acetyltransferase